MSRVIKRIDYRVRAEQLQNIPLPMCALTISKDFVEQTEVFAARFSATEEEDSTRINFVPTRGILDEGKYSISVKVSETALGHMLMEVIRTDFNAMSNKAMANYVMCSLLTGVSETLKADGYYYYDSIMGEWI
jgi:hypothetical protein